MSITLIRLNKPGINGLIYQRESFSELPNTIPLLSDSMDWSTLHGVAENVRFDKGCVVADIKFSDRTVGELFHSKKLSYVASGIGNVSKNNIVTEYTLKSAITTQDIETMKFMEEMQYRYDVQRET